MSSENALLEDIHAIIRADVKKIKAKGKDGELTRTQAQNLCDYAKVVIGIERHDQDQIEAAEKATIRDSELADLRVKAAALIAKGGA